MRLMQPSFASGEVSPLLHARVDLARYATALAELKNMIVLPEGGVTRRPGLARLGAAAAASKLIPFVYNNTDSVMLEFGSGTLRVWVNGAVGASYSTPYAAGDVKGLRVAQSGNVMILAHRNYPLYMLTRNSLTNWTLERFPFEGGPWVDGETVKAEAVVRVNLDSTATAYTNRTLTSTEAGTFTAGMVGSTVKLEYSVSGGEASVTSVQDAWQDTTELEVRGSFSVTTTGNNWAGKLRIERKTGRNGNWLMLREFSRTNSGTEGQIDFTVSETEPDAFYRASVLQTNGQQITVNTSSEAFTKSFVFRITSVSGDGRSAGATWQRSSTEAWKLPAEADATILGWWLNAWGREGSYPGAVAFYQDRLVLAGSTRQPQTLWMSRVGDYKDFSVSDPLADDDAITITLTARTADGIHSLVAADDLLAFTNGGEWKIAGAGDAGAISPKAVVAHQQGTIGSKSIQPVLAGGRVVFVQAHGTKVYALGYDLSADGYVGSELSILSGHLFDWKTAEGSAPANREIVDFAWQQVPDGLLWFALSDGTGVACTYNPEHETVGWGRQETPGGAFLGFACLPGDRQTELWAVVRRGSNYNVERLARRTDELTFSDVGTAFESVMQTLRVSLDGQDGSAFAAKKLIARLVVTAIRSKEAWAAPADDWQRRRRLTWDYSAGIKDTDVQLDNGFANDAAIQIRTSSGPLTIASISPVVTIGG